MRKTIIAVSLALGVAAGSVIAAQSEVPTNPNILQGVQQLQLSAAQEVAALQGIQSTLTSIQTALQGLIPAVSNVKTTAPVLGFSGQTIRCSVINLASQSRTVVISLLGPSGQVTNSAPIILQPLSSTIQNGSITAGEDVYACRFTVQNGTRTDITASLSQINAAADAVIAVVPAE